MTAQRLALGTVQFGQDYGVANASGQVAPGEVNEILSVAWAAGVDTIDTGAEYGVAERVLGEIGITEWRVVTKLPASDLDDDGVGWVHRHLEGSLGRLGVDHIHGLLVHRVHHLGAPGVVDGLLAVRDDGLVERIGASVYDPDELDESWVDGLDLVQIPANVFDRRIVTSGWLDGLVNAGVEVHTRSAFLQGLLLMDEWPKRFSEWSGVHAAWRSWCAESGVSPLRGALGAVLGDDRIDRVVVGVDSVAQLQEILDMASGSLPAVPEELAVDDPGLIDPTQWAS